MLRLGGQTHIHEPQNQTVCFARPISSCRVILSSLAIVQVFAMESVFGIPNAKDYERVTSTGDLYYVDSQVQPSRGHSFNSRFLCCVMPHQMYKGTVGKGLRCDMVSEIASDCCKLFHVGLQFI